MLFSNFGTIIQNKCCYNLLMSEYLLVVYALLCAGKFEQYPGDSLYSLQLEFSFCSKPQGLSFLPYQNFLKLFVDVDPKNIYQLDTNYNSTK